MGRENDRRLAISYKPQSNYNTLITPDDSPKSHLQILGRKSSAMTYGINKRDNADELTGSDQPTEETFGRHNTGFTLDVATDVDSLPIFFHSHFGAMASTAIAETSGGAGDNLVEHVITRQNIAVSQQKPAREIVNSEPSDEDDVRLPSMVSQSLNFSFGNADSEPMTLQQAFVGSGLRIPNLGSVAFEGGTVHVQKVANRKLLNNVQAYMQLGLSDGSGAAVAGSTESLTDCRLQSGSVNATDELDDDSRICIGSSGIHYWGNGGVGKSYTTSLAVLVNDMVKVGSKLYRVRTAGTMASSAPTDVTGNWFTSGGASLRYIGDIEDFGVISGRHLVRSRAIELQFVIDPATSDRTISRLQDGEPLDIIVGARGGLIQTGHYYQLLYHFFLSKYSTVESSFDNGKKRRTITAKIYLDQISGNDFSISIKNKQAGSLYV